MTFYKTKGELRAELLVKLGYGGLGAAAGNFVPYADGLLEEAQEQLFLLIPDFKRTRTWDFNTGLNQRWYGFPPDCDPERIMSIHVYRTDVWLPVKRGIDAYHDSYIDRWDEYTRRYDIRANPVAATQLQSNYDFSADDTSASGGTAGWNWGSSNWQISGGVAEQLSGTSSSLKSTLSTVVVGDTYDVTYTIGVADVDVVEFGGTDTGTDGVVLPLIIGTHSVTVTAVESKGLFVTASVAGTTIDDASVVMTGATSEVRLELWPLSASDIYPIRIEGLIQLAQFVEDGDRASIDDRLILLYAEAYGKAHLNRPDAQAKMNNMNRRLQLLRGQQHGELRYIRGEKDDEPPPVPVVV